MGWFKRKIKNPILGTALITSCGSPGNPRATRSTCILFVVVEGPGLAPASHEVRKQVKVARWPRPGMTLPCLIDPGDPDRFEIDFNAVPDWRDTARQQAEHMAERRAAGARDPVAAPSSVGGVTVVGATSPLEAAEALRRVETVLGTDLDGDGYVGGTSGR